MPIPLVDSPYLFEVPAVIEEGSLVLTPSSYASWPACHAANPTIMDFRLRKGSYLHWGAINSEGLAGGTAERYRTYRYEDTDDDIHPRRRSAENQAYVDAVKISGTGSSYFIFQGLAFDEPSVNCGATLGAHHVVFDFCWMKNPVTYGFRMVGTYGSYVQRCVVQDMVPSGGEGADGDTVAVQFKCVEELPDVLNINNFCLDNELINCGDGAGHTEATTLYQDVQSTIDGNDIYVEPDTYNDNDECPYENGLDFKAGSDDYRTIVSNNRMWGFRRNEPPATALGEGIVIQKFARNFLVERNIISDCPRGMKDENWPTTQYKFTANATTNELSQASHGLTTGGGPLTVRSVGGVLPVGLAESTPYWSIYVDSGKFKLATSRANALAGTAVDITTAGTGELYWRAQTGASRNITFRRNQWLNIRDFSSNDAGQVFLPITDIAFEDEVVAECTYAFANSPTQYYGPTFNGITLRNVASLQRPEVQTPALPWVPAQNQTVAAPVYPVVYDVYQRKRWTGPEWAPCAIVVTEEVAVPTVVTRTRLVATASPRRQAVRYGSARRFARR